MEATPLASWVLRCEVSGPLRPYAAPKGWLVLGPAERVEVGCVSDLGFVRTDGGGRRRELALEASADGRRLVVLRGSERRFAEIGDTIRCAGLTLEVVRAPEARPSTEPGPRAAIARGVRRTTRRLVAATWGDRRLVVHEDGAIDLLVPAPVGPDHPRASAQLTTEDAARVGRAITLAELPHLVAFGERLGDGPYELMVVGGGASIRLGYDAPADAPVSAWRMAEAGRAIAVTVVELARWVETGASAAELGRLRRPWPRVPVPLGRSSSHGRLLLRFTAAHDAEPHDGRWLHVWEDGLLELRSGCVDEDDEGELWGPSKTVDPRVAWQVHADIAGLGADRGEGQSLFRVLRFDADGTKRWTARVERDHGARSGGAWSEATWAALDTLISWLRRP